MLISQDWQEIYITIAEYDRHYEQYLDDSVRNIRIMQPQDEGTFLSVQEFGPFLTTEFKHMAHFGVFVLALSICQSRADV